MKEQLHEIDCRKVVGFVGGTNTRDRMPSISAKGYVMFDSELRRDDSGQIEKDDDRVPIYDLIYGPSSNQTSKRRVVDLVKNFESDGPDSIWALSQSIIKYGQQEPCIVQVHPEGNDQYLLVGGFGRWFANVIAHLTAPSLKADDTFLARINDLSDTEESRTLSRQLNMTHRSIPHSQEGKIYLELRENRNMSLKDIAKTLGIFNRKGGYNTARIQQYITLWDKRVTDELRSKVDAGEVALYKVLEKVKAARQGEREQTGKPRRGRKNGSKLRTMPYKNLIEVYNDDKVIEYFVKEKEDELSLFDAIKLGMAIALGKEKLPSKEELTLELEDAVS